MEVGKTLLRARHGGPCRRSSSRGQVAACSIGQMAPGMDSVSAEDFFCAPALLKEQAPWLMVNHGAGNFNGLSGSVQITS